MTIRHYKASCGCGNGELFLSEEDAEDWLTEHDRDCMVDDYFRGVVRVKP